MLPQFVSKLCRKHFLFNFYIMSVLLSNISHLSSCVTLTQKFEFGTTIWDTWNLC